MEKVDLKFHDKFIFRVPFYAFEKRGTSLEKLKDIVKDNGFQEAIYIASPGLYDEIQRWLINEINEGKEISKIFSSLYKYLSRMYSRCTPYGLFASCGTGNWQDANKIFLAPQNKRATRLDMNFVCALIQHLAKHTAIQPHLLFYPNTSIYKWGNQLRYVEYKYSNNKRIHSITSVDASEYLLEVLNAAKNGAKENDLIKILMDYSIAQSEAHSFVQEIINCQLLVTELEPSVTGEECIYQILVFLNALNDKVHNTEISNLISLFEKAAAILKKIDQQTDNEIVIYRELATLLKLFEVPLEENYLFQVDTFAETIEAKIDKKIQKEILQAITFLSKINNLNSNKNLDKFKAAFYERYENREVFLNEVLDTESGIGYPLKDVSGLNNTIDDLQISHKNEFPSISWNENENYLFKKLTYALENKTSIVKFSDHDVKSISSSPGRMAPTLSIMFKMINASEGTIQLNHIGGGSSAANLLGRFAYADEKIHGVTKDITSFEQKIFGNKIVAEIVHLPESRIGNILSRPVLREYEIPYLAKSGVAFEKQIHIEDLLISIKNNRIILRSKHLNKEIIPRLSTAHNYSFNSLPVYKFLCDLQMQDIEKPVLSFNWGSLSHSFPFLPRAEYNDIVLFPATWNLSVTDFTELCKKNSTRVFIDEVKIWKDKWKMPRWIVLKDGDNELLLDFENELSVKTFFNEIKNRNFIQLSEFLFDPDDALIKDEKGRPYTNEIIAILFNHDYNPSESVITPENKLSKTLVPVKRSFIPGSEWLYYKIYCGVKTADDLLRETIKPIIETLAKNELIEKWFFIRYSDPDIHIRLRFYNCDPSKLSEVMKLMNTSLQQMHKQGIISKVMTDTYNRELERYGLNSMEIAESFFEIDSWAILNLLQLAQGDTADELKWRYTIRYLDNLMDCFGFDIFRKLVLMEILKTNFTAEHSTEKDLKIQLDDKFRKMRPQLNNLFTNDQHPAAEILNWNKAQIQPIVDQLLTMEQEGELMVNLNDLISSYMHMSINRIFKAKQRTHEMVIYDQLYRYYKSKIAQEKSNMPHSDS